MISLGGRSAFAQTRDFHAESDCFGTQNAGGIEMAVQLVVKAGAHARRNCVTRAVVPWKGSLPKSVSMKSASETVVCAQVESQTEDSLSVVWVVPAMLAGETETWTLHVADEKTPEEVVCAQETDDQLSLKVTGTEVGRYQYGSKWARPFLYPLLAPKGLRPTRGFPVVEGIADEDHDHPHHKSVWVAHGDVNGTDNWSEHTGHGATRHLGFNKIISGSVFGGFSSSNEWLTGDEKKILSESREVLLYNTSNDERLLDFAITFHATEGDVKFGDTKEGGLLSVRVRGSMNGKREGLITNANGALTESETWGHRAAWCDYSGPADGLLCGIAVFDNEANPLFPTYWHVRDYGLMTANPFALSAYKNDKTLDGSWTLPAGKTATFRYRILIHLGNCSEGRVAEKYQDYANAPRVDVVSGA